MLSLASVLWSSGPTMRVCTASVVHRSTVASAQVLFELRKRLRRVRGADQRLAVIGSKRPCGVVNDALSQPYGIYVPTRGAERPGVLTPTVVRIWFISTARADLAHLEHDREPQLGQVREGLHTRRAEDTLRRRRRTRGLRLGT